MCLVNKIFYLCICGYVYMCLVNKTYYFCICGYVSMCQVDKSIIDVFWMCAYVSRMSLFVDMCPRVHLVYICEYMLV